MSYSSNAYLFYGVLYYVKNIDEEALCRYVYGADTEEEGLPYMDDFSETLLKLGLDVRYFGDADYVGFYLPETFNENGVEGLPANPIGKDSLFYSVLPEMGLPIKSPRWILTAFRE